MWIKICGITSIQDGRTAVTAGADAIGFVFAESPRRITPEAARQIAESLPPEVEKIGVFVNTPLDVVLHTVEHAHLTGVQLHGEDSAATASFLREEGEKIVREFRVVRVLHYAGNADRFGLQMRNMMDADRAATVLVDTGLAGRSGGTGIPFDWDAAEASFRCAAGKLHLIAAGGLTAENVARAIATLQPWGVDVSSGVESAPGRKHPERVEAFVQAARAAAQLAWTPGAAEVKLKSREGIHGI
ncbi:MAG TPA: phosphoribosylanthranilate isomerase [Acidobacteriaceae bacterium]|nr:phosphoribosylanthranilate isomerase [Acidobacteriaceae bacterium]